VIALDPLLQALADVMQRLESGSSLPDYDKRRTPAEAGAPLLALVLNTNRSFDRRSGAQWPS